MKAKIENQEQGFKPFDITLTVESAAEARLLWHVFNHPQLQSALVSDETYSNLDEYDENTANEFDMSAWRVIDEYMCEEGIEL